jgi:hypothetical protein
MALQHVDKKTAPSSAMVSADSVFTTLVAGARTNARLGVDTPRGALGGMVATISGADMQVVIANETTDADYLFYNDAAGGAYENAPSIASGKIALLPTNNGDVAFVDVYETSNAAESADLVYAVNNPLYASANGLLTNEEEAGSGLGVKVGVVAQVPTVDDPRLGVKLGK